MKRLCQYPEVMQKFDALQSQDDFLLESYQALTAYSIAELIEYLEKYQVISCKKHHECPNGRYDFDHCPFRSTNMACGHLDDGTFSERRLPLYELKASGHIADALGLLSNCVRFKGGYLEPYKTSVPYNSTTPKYVREVDSMSNELEVLCGALHSVDLAANYGYAYVLNGQREPGTGCENFRTLITTDDSGNLSLQELETQIGTLEKERGQEVEKVRNRIVAALSQKPWLSPVRFLRRGVEFLVRSALQ